MSWQFLVLGAAVGLAKPPIRRSYIVGDNGAAITCCDLEREGLSVKVRVALPVLAPIAGQGLPVSFWTFDGDRDNITSTTDIGYKN